LIGKYALIYFEPKYGDNRFLRNVFKQRQQYEIITENTSISILIPAKDSYFIDRFLRDCPACEAGFSTSIDLLVSTNPTQSFAVNLKKDCGLSHDDDEL
jgi:hypothetical protein